MFTDVKIEEPLKLLKIFKSKKKEMHKYDEKRINKLNVPKPRIKAKDFVFDDIYYMV